MNWLAHLYLSDNNAPFRVGNLLPDLISPSQLANLPEHFQRGIRQHRSIDVFTDAHPRVKSCVRRFPSPYRRFGGILTDVYFDYFLARDWSNYSSMPLPDFIAGFYCDIETCVPELPLEAVHRLHRIRDENWLATYPTLAGITDILARISHRFRRPFDLTGSLPVFQNHEPDFVDDFQSFFPELTAHVKRAEAR
jgi:acyl carrier protein phosphodiesterase